MIQAIMPAECMGGMQQDAPSVVIASVYFTQRMVTPYPKAKPVGYTILIVQGSNDNYVTTTY